MQLTAAQRTTLKTHMTANTNSTPATAADGTPLVTPFVVNTRLATGNPDNERAIAEWYNATATAGGNQPFTSLLVWNNRVTIAQLNAGIKWDVAAAGATAADRSESWAVYQALVWGNNIDMTDAQVRKGVLRVFGDVANGSAAGVATAGGQVTGRRLEIVLASNGGANATVGAQTAWGAAYKPVTLADGTVAANGAALLTQPDVSNILLNG